MKDVIYIPTYARPRVVTLDQFTPAMRKRALLVVHPRYAAGLREKHPDIKQLECPIQGQGFPAVRQWILDYGESRGERLHIVIDDDLVFQQAKWEDGKKRFRKATAEETEAAFDKISAKALEPGMGFASWSDPFFNLSEDEWELCRHAICAFFINTKTRKRTKATFGGIIAREDAWFELQTWAAGAPSYSLMSFAVRNTGDSGKGGESLIDETGKMTPGFASRGERTAQAHREMAEKFAPYVKLVERSNRRMDEVGTTVDIRVYGKRLYNAAVNNGSV